MITIRGMVSPFHDASWLHLSSIALTKQYVLSSVIFSNNKAAKIRDKLGLHDL